MECSLKAAVIRLFKIDVFLLRGAVTKRDIKVDQRRSTWEGVENYLNASTHRPENPQHAHFKENCLCTPECAGYLLCASRLLTSEVYPAHKRHITLMYEQAYLMLAAGNHASSWEVCHKTAFCFVPLCLLAWEWSQHVLPSSDGRHSNMCMACSHRKLKLFGLDAKQVPIMLVHLPHGGAPAHLPAFGLARGRQDQLAGKCPHSGAWGEGGGEPHAALQTHAAAFDDIQIATAADVCCCGDPGAAECFGCASEVHQGAACQTQPAAISQRLHVRCPIAARPAARGGKPGQVRILQLLHHSRSRYSLCRIADPAPVT
eukprot:1134431-Pelagomonas_calceolata.AAC.1